jgi:hypothetical protein
MVCQQELRKYYFVETTELCMGHLLVDYSGIIMKSAVHYTGCHYLTLLRKRRMNTNDYIEIEGTKTSVQSVTITVPKARLIDKAMDIVYDKYPKFKNNYIDKNNNWQMFSYTHPHNGEDQYETGENATWAEIAIKSHLEFLGSLRF